MRGGKRNEREGKERVNLKRRMGEVKSTVSKFVIGIRDCQLPRTGISSGTLRSVIEYGLPFIPDSDREQGSVG